VEDVKVESNSHPFRTPNPMTDPTLYEYLVEHAMFPFPEPVVDGKATSTDISDIDVGKLERQWKAIHAVPDNNLAPKLCDALRDILAGTPLTEDSKGSLEPLFLPALRSTTGGRQRKMWLGNTNEAEVSLILVPCEFTLSLRDRAAYF